MNHAEIPQAYPDQPEAGVQVDIFGVETRHFPKARGKATQISMDAYLKLEELKKKEE